MLFKRIIPIVAVFGLALSPLQVQISHSIGQKLLPPSHPYGGVLVIGSSNPPLAINPVITNTGISMSVASLVFNRLIHFRPDGELEPELAESWDISADGLVYTFHLRRGIQFHDGEEFTSEDVLFTYTAIQDPAAQSPYHAFMKPVVSFSAPDRYTFKVTLEKPYVPFINEMVREIIPKHLYVGTSLRNNEFNYKPVGTGPFRFEKWLPDNQIILRANPDYFEGRPYLDKIIFKTYEKRSEVWTAFMRQEVDLISFMHPEDYEITKKDPIFKTYACPTADYYVINYDLEDPVLADQNLRIALAHAVNTQELIDKVEHGYGVKCVGPFQPGYWTFNPDVKPFAYDPSLAMEILKKDGWKDADGDGILEKDGRSLAILMAVDAEDEKLRTIAFSIRQQLQEVGIKLEIQFYSEKTDLAPALSLRKPQAHLTLFLGNAPDPHQAVKVWDSRDSRKYKFWNNRAVDQEVDRMIELGEVTMEKYTRRRIYQELHQRIYQWQPACFLYFPYDFHAVSKTVEGTDPLFESPYMPEYTIKDLWIRRRTTPKDRKGVM